MIETACDLLKYVVRYFRTSIYFDVSYGLWHELTDPNVWLGLAFAIVLVVLSTWVLDAWKWADPRRSVRTTLVVVSVIVTGFVDPFGYIFRKDLLQAFEKAQKGETMDVVMHRFDYPRTLASPQTENHNSLWNSGPLPFSGRQIAASTGEAATSCRKETRSSISRAPKPGFIQFLPDCCDPATRS